MNLTERIERRHNAMILWRSETHRMYWELDRNTGAVVEYREEHWRKHRGRFCWVQRAETTWSNPEYGGFYRFGKMEHCPLLPIEDSTKGQPPCTSHK